MIKLSIVLALFSIIRVHGQIGYVKKIKFQCPEPKEVKVQYKHPNINSIHNYEFRLHFGDNNTQPFDPNLGANEEVIANNIIYDTVTDESEWFVSLLTARQGYTPIFSTNLTRMQGYFSCIYGKMAGQGPYFTTIKSKKIPQGAYNCTNYPKGIFTWNIVEAYFECDIDAELDTSISESYLEKNRDSKINKHQSKRRRKPVR